MSTIMRAHDVARTDHDHAAELLRPEVRATEAMLHDLTPGEWRLPTDCERWDVHDIVAHLVGNAEITLDPDLMEQRAREGAARFPELYLLDAMNEMAAVAWRDRPPASLIDEHARLWSQVIDALPTMPESARARTFDAGYPGVPPFTFGYITDVILARDMWMHRVDICRATGRACVAGEHSRGIVEQVLRDLDDMWDGPPVVLELTAGVPGSWQIGAGSPVATVRADAVDFVRNLSGRTRPEPELTLLHGDSNVLDMLRAARVPF
jgi:uncharacterized protein (TIGR03083 family)